MLTITAHHTASTGTTLTIDGLTLPDIDRILQSLDRGVRFAPRESVERQQLALDIRNGIRTAYGYNNHTVGHRVSQ